MRINNVRLFGQFQDCKAFTDQSLRLERGHTWREYGMWYSGCFVMDGTNFINVRVEHDCFDSSKELFEQCQDRVIEGILHTEISRGTGVVSHWIEITKCSHVLAPVGTPVEQPMDFDNKCVEVCPHCGHETEFEVSQLDEKGLLTCSHCGERIYACSMCALLDGSPQCDWDEKTRTCSFKLFTQTLNYGRGHE